MTSNYALRICEVFALPAMQHAPHVRVCALPENRCLLIEPVTGWYSEATGGYITRGYGAYAYGAYAVDFPKEGKRL